MNKKDKKQSTRQYFNRLYKSYTRIVDMCNTDYVIEGLSHQARLYERVSDRLDPIFNDCETLEQLGLIRILSRFETEHIEIVAKSVVLR